MSIFLMTFSDSEKSEFWDTPMAHMVTCFGNYHFLPLFLSTYSIPRILLEFAPPLKNSKKWGFQPRRIFFNGRILCGSGDGGWSTTVCSGHIWEALRCPFANYVLQKCVTVTDDHDAMDVYSLPLVGCFFFEIERDMMAMKWRWICFWVCFDEFLLKSRMHPETLWKILGKLKIQSQNLTWRLVLLLQLWVCLEKWIAMFQSLLGKCHRHFLLPAAMGFFSDLPTWDSTLLTISESTRYFHARIWTSFLWNWSKKASSTKGEIRGEERDKKLRSW